MKFFCVKGQSLELSILGYEYPDAVINKDDHNWFKDSNWLMIFINVRLRKIRWDVSAPVLNIYEVKYLTGWFKDLSNNKTVDKMVDFIEPELSFKLLNNFDSTVKIIKIRFASRFSPTEIFDDSLYKKYSFAKLKATNEQLKKYAQEIENELEKYPDRDE